MSGARRPMTRSVVPLLFCLFCASATGAELRNLTTAEAARLARRIVVAVCRAIDVHEEAGQIFTFTSFETVQVAKGTIPPRFTLRLVGGRIGNVEVDAALTPRFVPGEQLVLFLGADNRAGYPVIIPQAVFRVRTRPGTSESIVDPPPRGLPLYRKRDGRAYPTPPPSQVPLDDFVFSLQKLQ